ncbi:Uncharacterised protein [Mycobacteroides abscessus subsp. abscessus]|uniref:hypothetical protein n=1 Tax=Mycobacteroides abscessus TaxID=36809 RepID=UPI0009275194|nr:hypothetical protein [Mycobacteroides abscessus]SHR30014.1 Uncharacterised protein [Mycobacteroides abscessus subsp. abscessus]
MSQHFLVTLLVLVLAAAFGSLALALLLRWRDQRDVNQQAMAHHRRLAAIRRTQRQAERHIDHLTLTAIEHLVTTTHQTDLP